MSNCEKLAFSRTDVAEKMNKIKDSIVSSAKKVKGDIVQDGKLTNTGKKVAGGLVAAGASGAGMLVGNKLLKKMNKAKKINDIKKAIGKGLESASTHILGGDNINKVKGVAISGAGLTGGAIGAGITKLQNKAHLKNIKNTALKAGIATTGAAGLAGAGGYAASKALDKRKKEASEYDSFEKIASVVNYIKESHKNKHRG